MRNLIILMVIISLLYSCAPAWMGLGAGIGIGAYKYIEGNLERDYPLSYERAWDITNEALANLKISITSSFKEKTTARIDAVRRDGKNVIIKLKDKGQGVTSIGIRVGVFGNRVLSEKIHDEIASVAGLK